MKLSEFLIVSSQQTPPISSRARICGIHLTFQGLTITTRQYGTQPWFELAYQTLASNDRADVRAQKHAVGDTHQILEFFTHEQSIYDEPGQPWQQAISPSGEVNLTWFRLLVEELIDDGIIPIVVFDGDNGDNFSDGYPNALHQLPILTQLLAGLHGHILYARFWDGVFYGSTPNNIAHFGRVFRSLIPNGYLAIEHQPGRIPVGNGPSDYEPNGRMVDYDVICGEFQNGLPRTSDPNPDTNPGSSIWMVIDRMVRPWNRPADMPTQPTDKWDPNPPFYLENESPRGPYFYCAFEFDAYRWVRSQVSASEVAQERAYLQSLGATYTG